jgi:hypothetical protein
MIGIFRGVDYSGIEERPILARAKAGRAWMADYHALTRGCFGISSGARPPAVAKDHHGPPGTDTGFYA